MALLSSILGTNLSQQLLDGLGNITIEGSGKRITGDFSNAVLASRVAFQTNTINGATNVTVVPNGTSQNAFVRLHNNSDPTNSSTIHLAISADEASIRSAAAGTGTYLPMTFYTNAVERIKVDNSGIIKLSSTAAAYDSSPGDGVGDGLYFQVDSAGIAHIDAYSASDSTGLSFGANVGGSVVNQYLTISSSGTLSFNSGFGSLAPAYGCRAWTNFNGTGTIVIRGSGNVSSVTDVATGRYTMNFIVAMPDVNYSVHTTNDILSPTRNVVIISMSTTGVQVGNVDDNVTSGSSYDATIQCISVFR